MEVYTKAGTIIDFFVAAQGKKIGKVGQAGLAVDLPTGGKW